MEPMKVNTPRFATEAEEVAWYEQNQEQVTQDFLRAEREGRLERGLIQRKIREAKERAAQASEATNQPA